MSHTKSGLFAFGASLIILGAGCNDTASTSTKYERGEGFFAKKQECAKYLEKAEKDVEEYNKTMSDAYSGSGFWSSKTLMKVCYTETTDSCISLISSIDRTKGKGTTGEALFVSDLLTGENLKSSYYILFDDDTREQRVRKQVLYIEEKNAALEQFKCVD